MGSNPIGGTVLIASLAKLARRGSRPRKPPTSSSVADEKRVGALLLSTAPRDPGFDCLARQARSARIAPQKPPTSSSVADEKRVGALLLSTAPRDPGFDCLARQAR